MSSRPAWASIYVDTWYYRQSTNAYYYYVLLVLRRRFWWPLVGCLCSGI